MANRRGDQSQFSIGPAWWTYKGMELGFTQGATINATAATHETKADQAGETVLAETALGQAVSGEISSIELNPGMMASIMPASKKILETVAYQTDADGGDASELSITFTTAFSQEVKIGDEVQYTDSADAAAIGSVARVDTDAKKIFLMDDDAAPKTTPSASLFFVKAVEGYNNAGINLMEIAGKLIGVPKDPNDKRVFIIYKAGLTSELGLSFVVTEEKKLPLKLKGYPSNEKVDENGNGILYFYGDVTV